MACYRFRHKSDDRDRLWCPGVAQRAGQLLEGRPTPNHGDPLEPARERMADAISVVGPGCARYSTAVYPAGQRRHASESPKVSGTCRAGDKQWWHHDAAQALVHKMDGGFLYWGWGDWIMAVVTVNERIRTTELPSLVGKQVELAGWLHTVRRLGGVTFLVLRDGWGTAQIVSERPEEMAHLVGGDVQPESVLCVRGMVVASPQAPGGVELHAPQIEVLEAVAEPLPVVIGKKEIKAGLVTQLDHAVFVNRHPARRAVYRLAAGAMAAFREHLAGRGFTEIQSPKLVASATESGANVFAVDYFGQTAYLAQSPQFYKQIMVGVFERVYEVGPVFRAEPHDTTRHVNEYVSLDVEFGFIENHFTVMALLRDVLAHICAQLAERYPAELALAAIDLPQVPAQIPHIHFAEAQELILRRHGVDVRGEPDLSPQDERWLGEWAQAEHGSDFLFVTGYPAAKRPFYTHPDPARPGFTNSFDLLFRGTELVTGGQRLHRYADYLAALAARGLPVEPFATYLEAFRYGMPPHGGFAIGLERLLMQMAGMPNIRLASLFPRDLARLAP
jgi:nondiscriminating aspartyl-tRNA synthetase